MSKKTIGEEFFQDPRIKEAKKLIREALSEHQSKIDQVKSASDDLKEKYQKLLEDFSNDRGGKLFYDYLGSGIGNGPLVELMDGSVKYDFITGIGVHFFGHSNLDVIEAEIDGAISSTTMSGNLQQNIDSPRLFKLLLEGANKYGAKFDHLFMTSSGVMAAENSLKMAFQKRAPAHRVIAFEKCFMGRTLSVSQITDKAAYRQGLPKNLTVDYIPFYKADQHDRSIEMAVKHLEWYFERYPGEYAAMCMELVQGEGGYWVGHEDFFKAICETCHKHNVSVIVDEVQTFMRTSELFAFQYFKLDKHVDFVNIGKNSQICATLYKSDHKPKPGLISQTFTSSATAINAAYYMIKHINEKNFLGEDGKIMQLFNHFSSKLDDLSKKYPDLIQGPWGVGAMVGMTVFKGDTEKSKKFTFKLFENGVLSFMAGSKPTRVRFLMPAAVVEKKDIDKVVEIIEKTLKEV